MVMTEVRTQQSQQTNPDVCPRCGVSRSQLKGMISEPPYHPYNPWGTAFDRGWIETENHAMARYLIGNGQDCKEAIEAWQKRMAEVKAHGIHII
jgi:hypothetical protein